MKLQREFQPEGHILESPVALHRLYIKKEYQGLGYGTRLIQEAFGMARKEGFKYLWLGVWYQNLRAIQLYERMGFEIFGNYLFIMGSIVSNDYLMKMPLE